MIALDTHALMWWVSEPKRIPAKARRLLDGAARLTGTRGGVVDQHLGGRDAGRAEAAPAHLDLNAWIGHLETLPFLQFVPVENRVAARAVALEGFPHSDPTDRMILATAMGLGATLVTADARLRAFRAVKSVWS